MQSDEYVDGTNHGGVLCSTVVIVVCCRRAFYLLLAKDFSYAIDSECLLHCIVSESDACI